MPLVAWSALAYAAGLLAGFTLEEPHAAIAGILLAATALGTVRGRRTWMAGVASLAAAGLLVATAEGARERNLRLLGTRHEVLVEREAKRGEAMLMTRTRDFKTVLVPGDASMLGSYLTVELTGTTGSTFTGAIVRERQPLPMAG